MNQKTDMAKSGDPERAKALMEKHKLVESPVPRRGPQDFLLDVAEFHEKFGLEYNGKPRLLPHDLHKFRMLFLREEIDEHEQFQLVASHEASYPLSERNHSIIEHALEMQLDALVDEMYVLIGTVYLQGLMPVFEEAWTRVHEANMRKIRSTDDEDPLSKRKSKYDVVKPPGWVPPSHTDLVADNAHKEA